MTKKWYQSKTLWVNLLALAIATVDAYNASFGMPTELYAFAIPVLNMALRIVSQSQLTY